MLKFFNSLLSKIIPVLLIFGFVFPQFSTAEENLEVICQMDQIDQRCQSLGSTECRKFLEKCEKYYQEQSDKISQDINKTAGEKKNLQNAISGLNKKINNLSYQISQSNLVIKDLGFQITDTTNSIEKTSLKLEELKGQLAEVLRTIDQEDKRSMVEVMFAESELSGFFDDLLALEVLSSKNKEFLQNVRILRTNLEQQKVSLDDEKGSLEKTVKIQALQKEESARTKNEQEYYLQITEQEYQKQLKEKEEVAKKASAIRARIFELSGVTKAPTFGEAYDIAKYVASVTGIEPAFLLAVLTQESDIGKNVGQCVLTDASTGAGKKIKDGTVMKNTMSPKRDTQPFLTITRELGRDPYNTPVSCPMSYGWGGAMGPAQFIPSTWMLYRDKIASITGKAGDPWNINDAFLASALYLTDYGAKTHTDASEWKAAMIYFSGSTNTRYRFYGDSVIAITKRYREDIKALEAAK